jgi:hypothetical protein
MNEPGFALHLCQKIGASTMFTDFNEGMSLPLEVSKRVAKIAIAEILRDCERDWQEVIEEIDKL